jgi:hypothetical protein
MIELWKSLSDDQVALVGCAAALIVTGTMMSLSYYIGRGRIASGKRIGESSVLDSQAGRLQPTASQSAALGRRNAA